MGFSNVMVALSFSSAPLVFEALIQQYDWRTAWQMMSMVLFFVFPVVIFLFFRDDPRDYGLSPDGISVDPNQPLKKKRFEVKKDFTLKEARKTYTFWIFAGFLAMHGLYITGFTFHVVSIFEEVGMSRADAVSIFQPAAVVAVVVTQKIVVVSCAAISLTTDCLGVVLSLNVSSPIVLYFMNKPWRVAQKRN